MHIYIYSKCSTNYVYVNSYLELHAIVLSGHDRMVVGFTTYAISAYHHLYCEFESRSG